MSYLKMTSKPQGIKLYTSAQTIQFYIGSALSGLESHNVLRAPALKPEPGQVPGDAKAIQGLSVVTNPAVVLVSTPTSSLQVYAGPNVNELKQISYNDNSSHAVKSPNFDGLISVHIKGEGEGEGVAENGRDVYFAHESRTTRTWSIRMQGRFLNEINGNDVLFGNLFDRPLTLPWGFSAALSFVQYVAHNDRLMPSAQTRYVDPTLQHDLYSEKPWALSPFLSTMPYIQRTHIAADTPVPTIPSTLLTEDKSEPPLAPSLKSDLNPASRRKYFADENHRKEFTFTPQDLISADFCHGYLRFPSLTFDLPGGMQFDLMSYYDERPVHFICKERGDHGQTFFVVSFVVLKDGDGNESGESEVAPIDSSDID